MKKVLQYPLKFEVVQMVEMPKGAAVLAVQTRRDVPWIWVEADPEAEPICRSFVTYETGEPLDDGAATSYVGTYQLRGGEVAFHVYTDRVEYPRGS